MLITETGEAREAWKGLGWLSDQLVWSQHGWKPGNRPEQITVFDSMYTSLS